MSTVRLVLVMTFAVVLSVSPASPFVQAADTSKEAEVKLSCGTKNVESKLSCGTTSKVTCSQKAPCGNTQCQNCCPPRPERPEFGPRLREALTPADQPIMGVRPLIQPRQFGAYGPYDQYGRYGHGQYGPGQYEQYGQYGPERGYPARFPRIRSMFVPASPYMTTKPAPPMQTYTVRGPRDFLNPNPPSIGY